MKAYDVIKQLDTIAKNGLPDYVLIERFRNKELAARKHAQLTRDHKFANTQQGYPLFAIIGE